MTTPLPADAPSPRSGRPLVTILIIVVVALACLLLLAGLLLYPAIRAAREAARASLCVNHLKQLSIAILTYHDANRSYPPAYIADADGKPMHSWRVLILPYLEDPVGNEVYQSYRFDEPWISEHNAALAAKMPDVFRCPIDPADTAETHYVAIVGEDTMWPGDRVPERTEMLDGTYDTVLLVEAGETAVPWLEPRDISPDEFIAELPTSNHRQGCVAAMADGSVIRIGPDADEWIVHALLTIAGGERVNREDVY